MKRFKKALVIVLALIVVLTVVLTGCSQNKDVPILTNGNFEQINKDNGDKTAEGWKEYHSTITEEIVDEKGNKKPSERILGTVTFKENAIGSVEFEKRGKTYVKIETSDYAVTYLYQKVKLYSGKKYSLTVNYKVDNKITTQTGDTDAVGAYFGFLQDANFEGVQATNKTTSGWVEYSVYFTPDRTGNYTFIAGIGREDLGGAMGSVEFDNISIQTIDEFPAGYDNTILSYTGNQNQARINGIIYTVILSVFSICLIVGAYYLLRNTAGKQSDLSNENKPLFDANGNGKNNGETSQDGVVIKKKLKQMSAKDIFLSPLAIFIYIIIATFAIRFILLMTLQGMKDLMIEYADIALTLATDGPTKLFATMDNVTLPTGMLYLLYFIGLIGNAAELVESSIGMTMLIRIPQIIADIITCYLIYSLIAKNYDYKHSAIVAGVYALLPAMFTASGAWGMNVSISLMFVVAMVSLMIDKNYIGVSATYTCALLFSNSMLILLPLVLAYQIYYCVIDKKSILPNVLTAICSFVVFYCLSIPFAIDFFASEQTSKGIFMVFTKMLADIKSTNLVSNNTFNFFAMCGLGTARPSTVMIVMVALIMVIFAGLGGYMYLKSKNRLDFVLLAGLSFIVWSVFGIGAKMENMLIGVVLLFIYSCLKMEKRTFKIFGVFAVTLFINMAVVLTNSGYINYILGSTAGYAPFYKLDALYIIGSIVNVVTTIYLIWVAFDIMVNKLESEIKPLPANLVVEFKQDMENKKLRIQKFFKRK